VLSLVHVAIWSRYMRTATLDAIGQEFVKTARAKGASERRVLMKHVLGRKRRSGRCASASSCWQDACSA
jgi:ABC-type dipeptide/oligopeptide/nickel transport system permease component